ncbi:MAG: hypothetical protein ACOC28_04050 [Alkalispirochaetaceae bacterium]
MAKIYLALNNCFALKRWVRPGDWAPIYRRFGVNQVEASADVELDPLLMTPTYLKRWEEEARRACDAAGLRIATFYSGHGTYATTGLMHPDQGVRSRIREHWIGDVARRAGRFSAGVGFFLHALDQESLENRELYLQRLDELAGELALVAEMAGAVADLTTASVEQMYSPHQPPWRIAETTELLAEIYRRSRGCPLYTTLDLGHGGPQSRFLMPTAEAVCRGIEGIRRKEVGRLPYLGRLSAEGELRELARGDASPETLAEEFLESLESSGHLFARQEDCDPYNWLRALGPWSPVIHLQQTDGRGSGHKPFTAGQKESGVIEAKKVLAALAESFEERKGNRAAAMPPPVERIYLTLEIFAPTAADPRELLAEVEESVAYWREAIPTDGLELSELV